MLKLDSFLLKKQQKLVDFLCSLYNAGFICYSEALYVFPLSGFTTAASLFPGVGLRLFLLWLRRLKSSRIKGDFFFSFSFFLCSWKTSSTGSFLLAALFVLFKEILFSRVRAAGGTCYLLDKFGGGGMDWNSPLWIFKPAESDVGVWLFHDACPSRREISTVQRNAECICFCRSRPSSGSCAQLRLQRVEMSPAPAPPPLSGFQLPNHRAC